MSVCAALMTGPATGPIATIKLFGESAEGVLSQVFEPNGGPQVEYMPGRIWLGRIVDNDGPVDQVTIGCEGECAFAVHCHGNPLIVERIMQLLRQRGVTLCGARELLAKTLASEGTEHPIADEAKLALTGVKTLAGARLIAMQVDAGLSRMARQWLEDVETASLDGIKRQAARVLVDSDIARLLIEGVTVVLAGPPNTGKSTLLNALAGRQKALVTDIRGTTRDWVSAEIRMPPLAMTLIDTAGLDFASAASDDLDSAAQNKSMERLAQADVILLVLDGSRPTPPLAPLLLEHLAPKRTVVILNKADLPERHDEAPACRLEAPLVRISAERQTGLEDLTRAVLQVCRVDDLASDTAIAFTDRQRRLLEQLRKAETKKHAVAAIKELLEGRLVL
jgi:tRNA modification GTPase